MNEQLELFRCELEPTTEEFEAITEMQIVAQQLIDLGFPLANVVIFSEN